MTERWLQVNEARRDLSCFVREAALGRYRFIICRGKHRQYQAALIPYNHFQRWAALEAAATAGGTVTVPVAFDGDVAAAATPGPAVRPPAAELFAENLHPAHGQDRIAAEHVHGVWPLIIVADGVGGTPGGAETANAALQASRAYLREHVPELSSCEQVLQVLRQTSFHAADQLNEQDLSGATTLLIALLWSSPESSFWCYSYVGDGFLTLLSPSRPVDGLTVPERLLTPQKAEGTACVRRTGLTGPPVVGLRLMEPGDVLFWHQMASSRSTAGCVRSIRSPSITSWERGWVAAPTGLTCCGPSHATWTMQWWVLLRSA